MAVNQGFWDYINDQLSPLTHISSKKMFGGVGYFHEDKMFGMIQSNGIFRLKVDDRNRATFEKYGSGPLTSAKKKGSMPYYEVPLEIVENQEELLNWVRTSIEIAHS